LSGHTSLREDGGFVARTHTFFDTRIKRPFYEMNQNGKGVSDLRALDRSVNYQETVAFCCFEHIVENALIQTCSHGWQHERAEAGAATSVPSLRLSRTQQNYLAAAALH